MGRTGLAEAVKALSLGEFCTLLRTLPAEVRRAEKHGLEQGAVMIEREAKDLIGTEYPGWPALADVTVERKAAKGQTGRVSSTDPLYATGGLRNSIGYQVEGRTAIIGTPDEVGVYQELGTSRIPPRPFLAAAAVRKGEDAAKAIGKAVQHALAGLPLPGA